MSEKNFYLCYTQELKPNIFDDILQEFEILKAINNVIIFKPGGHS